MDIMYLNECPICHSEDISSEIQSHEGDQMNMLRDCLDCGVEWVEFFKYDGMDILDDTSDPLFI
jgi:uncharacterized Zn finger protein